MGKMVDQVVVKHTIVQVAEVVKEITLQYLLLRETMVVM
jgi:hypothetical protein